MNSGRLLACELSRRAEFSFKNCSSAMFRSRLYSTSLLVVLLFLAALSPEKPKILIIGDSISIGYTPFVQQQLSDKATVSHNPGNAQHTGKGLASIDEWLEDEQWDIVHFNWGLWDLCYRHPDSKVQGNRDKKNGTITYSIEEYAANLDSLVTMLRRKTDARLVFATTTYVPKHEAGRFSDDALKYNEAAKKVMQKHSIVVNDLYPQSRKVHKKFGKGLDDVHYTDEGYEKLGRLVTDFLEKEMASLDSR